MGEGPVRSAFEGKPGYRPPDDPEANAVVVGRREAPDVDLEFKGGASSSTELAHQILDALRDADRKALDDLRVPRTSSVRSSGRSSLPAGRSRTSRPPMPGTSTMPTASRG